MAQAIRTPKPLRPSEWAERHRYLPPSVAAEPGPWRNDRTPYLAGIMDATVEPGVEQLIFLKAVQVGFSEATRNLIGFWADHDPGPAMLVMPTQQAAEEAIEERIRPLLAETPRLARHLMDDRAANKLSAIRLDTMTLYTGWSGSPQALASRPIRYMVFDEVDKYPAFSGKEADPISLGLKRLTTYGHRARAIIGSTPTTRLGTIWRAWEDCTQHRRFFVPCPHCGHRQTLKWSCVRWPQQNDNETRQQQAERIESQKLARYECESCAGQWDDAQKSQATRLGEWRSEGTSNRRVGFHLNSIYSPWLGLSRLAGEWLRSQGNPAKLMDFANSRLAEPFEEQTATAKPDLLRDKAKLSGPPMVVPAWAQLLIATADVQKNHLWYAIRAWGHGMQSQLVRYGVAGGFDELWQAWTQGYAKAGTGEVVPLVAGGIDARYRTDEVLAWCMRSPAQLWPIMGSDQLRTAPVTERALKAYNGLVQRTVNANHWRDVLHGYITSDDPTQWLPHSGIGDDYIRQMASEHRVRDPKSGQSVWQKVSEGNDNHLWDCEVLQCVMAWLLGASTLPETNEQNKANQDQSNIEASAWMSRGRGKW